MTEQKTSKRLDSALNFLLKQSAEPLPEPGAVRDNPQEGICGAEHHNEICVQPKHHKGKPHGSLKGDFADNSDGLWWWDDPKPAPEKADTEVAALKRSLVECVKALELTMHERREALTVQLRIGPQRIDKVLRISRQLGRFGIALLAARALTEDR